MPDIACLTVIIHGSVQGVGFRFRTKQIASNYAVSGQVRNLRDGTVEIIAEGIRTEVQGFLTAVATSSLGEHISEKKEQWSRPTKRYNSFDISH